MTRNNRKIDFLRQHIPAFECKPGCHDCCGPVTTSSEEMARLPVKTDAEHDIALAELNCPYLGKNGCEVYEERPPSAACLEQQPGSLVRMGIALTK